MTKDNTIKVGFCVAYDWMLLRYSLPLVYAHADKICLTLDSKRTSWVGEPFDFDETAFHSFIQSVDKENKILVIEENFHVPTFTPMQNEVRQRNRMAECLSPGGWHIQLDADEYFVDFFSFVKYLKTSSVDQLTNVCCVLTTLFKKVSGGYLIINAQRKENLEIIAVASRKPFYEYGRRNGYFNHFTNHRIIHQSWARSEDEILQKVNNWGHSNDFDVLNFVVFWRALNAVNHLHIQNFHPVKPEQWPSLIYIKADSIEYLIQYSDSLFTLLFTKLELIFKNSKLISRLRKVRESFKMLG